MDEPEPIRGISDYGVLTSYENNFEFNQVPLIDVGVNSTDRRGTQLRRRSPPLPSLWSSKVKRLFFCCAIGVFGLSGFVGCGEETKVKKTETIKTPEGKTTITDEKKVETSGKNPPATP
jgi:hypothetical protein